MGVVRESVLAVCVCVCVCVRARDFFFLRYISSPPPPSKKKKKSGCGHLTYSVFFLPVHKLFFFFFLFLTPGEKALQTTQGSLAKKKRKKERKEPTYLPYFLPHPLPRNQKKKLGRGGGSGALLIVDRRQAVVI